MSDTSTTSTTRDAAAYWREREDRLADIVQVADDRGDPAEDEAVDELRAALADVRRYRREAERAERAPEGAEEGT